MELEELLAAERAGWDALRRGEGAQFYGDLMAPDGVMILPHGYAFGRDAVKEALGDARTWSAYWLSSPQRIALGDDSVALVYVAEVSGEGDLFHALISSVYARRNDRWGLVLHQQTRRDVAL